jgi:putative membrane protein
MARRSKVKTSEQLLQIDARASSLMSEDDQERVARAITDAERRTAGEIVAVISSQASSYLYAPFMWAALAALLVPWPLIYFTWVSVQWIYAAQLVAFLVLLALMLPRPVRMMLVPRSIKHARAHRHATEQFLVQNLHTTAGRTGVLIFVSVAERYAAVLADTGIDAKVPPGTWQEIVDNLTAEIGDGRPADAFVHAIEKVGKLLTKYFPPGSADPNELPDHLIVLE